jgi:hypothetical protein
MLLFVSKRGITMPIIFEVKELQQDWNPPFEKKSSTEEFTVNTGESFCVDKQGNKIFTFLETKGEKALISFNDQYTVKGYEIPTNRKLWVDKIDYKSFSALWESSGITKMLKIKQIY